MRRGLFAAGAIWGGSILLSRIVGLVREGALGRTLGVGADADLYQAAFTVPDFLNYLLAGGALAVVFVPLQAAHLARGDERAAWRSVLSVGKALAVLLAAAGVLFWLAMPAFVVAAAPGFDAAQHAELARLSRILLPAQAFHILGGLLTAALLARDRHLVPALAPLVYNATIVAVGLSTGTAEGFAWGVLFGSFAGPFLLPLAACVRLGLVWERVAVLGNPDLRAWILRSLPIMAGFSIVVADDWFLRAHGTRIGTGAAATLAYAKALLRVPVGVFGLAAGVAAYPTLARLAAQGRHEELRGTLSRALRVVVVLALLAQAVLTAAGADAAALVYGRTRLSGEEIALVGDALALCALGMAAWAAQPLLARGFYARGETWAPALLGTAVALIAWPVYALAAGTLGVLGLALTSAGAITAHAIVLRVVLGRRLGPARAGAAAELLAFSARALASFGVALAAGLLAARALPAAEALGGSLLRAGAVGAVTVGVFAGAGAAVNLGEVRAALVRARSRLLRRGAKAETSPDAP